MDETNNSRIRLNTDPGFREQVQKLFPLLFPHLSAVTAVELLSLTRAVVGAAAQAQANGLVLLGDFWTRLMTGLELERERRGLRTYAELVAQVVLEQRGDTGAESKILN